MSSGPHRELARIADGDGPGAGCAKTALGDSRDATRLRAAILALAAHRGPDSSICPSDAARAVGGDGWRELSGQSRRIAFELAAEGGVDVTQRGDVIDPRRPAKGPIRIRIKPA